MTETDTETPTWETSDTPPSSSPPAEEAPTSTPQPQQEPDWLKTLALNCCSIHFQFHFHDPDQAINQRRVVVQAEGLSIAVEVADVSEISQAIERAAATAVGAKGWEPALREKQIFADQAEVEEFAAKIGQFGEEMIQAAKALEQVTEENEGLQVEINDLQLELDGLRIENERLNKENGDLITALETDIAKGTQEKLDAHQAARAPVDQTPAEPPPEAPATTAEPTSVPTPTADKPKNKGGRPRTKKTT